SPPKIYLVDDLFPRAFTVGRGPRSSTLAVSTGLLGALPPDELAAVLAHELAHVRSRDVMTQTFVVLLASMLVETSRLRGWLSHPLRSVLAPVAAPSVPLLRSPKGALRTDIPAATLTGSPHAPADALPRLARASELVSFAASPASSPLYPIDLFDDSKLARMF